MIQIDGNVVYDIEEMSNLLGLSTKTVRKYCVAQIIKAKKIGRRWHASTDALKEFIGAEAESTGECSCCSKF